MCRPEGSKLPDRRPPPQHTVDHLDHWVTVCPEKRLFTFLNVEGSEKRSYTYRAFCASTSWLADYLRQNSSLRYGDRALIACPPGLDMVRAFFACLRLGIIPVP